MRQRSTRAAASHARRIKRLKDTTHGPDRCQWPTGCASEANDAHESLNRSQGGDAEDPDWLLCRDHHDIVTTAHGEMREWCIEHGLIDSASLLRSRIANATVAAMPTPRKPIAIRVSVEADEWVSNAAKSEDVNRAVVIRAMLSVATGHPAEVIAKIRAIADIDRHARPSEDREPAGRTSHSIRNRANGG